MPMKSQTAAVQQRQSLKLQGNRLAATDFETTGLQPGWHEPIQVAIVPLGSQLRPLAGVQPFYRLIRPRYPERADAGAMNVHKIPMEELMEAADPDDVAEDLVEWVRSLDLPASRQLIPLAHPWAFEYGFYSAWLGLPLTSFIFHRNARCSRSAALAMLDAASLSKKTLPFHDVNLSALCKFASLKNDRPHDALWDSLAEAEVYRRLTTWGA